MILRFCRGHLNLSIEILSCLVGEIEGAALRVFDSLSDGSGLGELNLCFFVSYDDLLGFLGFICVKGAD